MLPAPLRTPRLLLIALAASAPFALSACTSQSGGNTFSGTKKDAQNVITKMSDYADDRNAEAICTKLFTAKLQAEFAKVGRGTCAAPVLLAIRNADYTRLGIDSIDLNGTDVSATRAEVRIKVQKDGPIRGIVLVRDNAKAPWRIDSFAAKVIQTTAATTPSATTPKGTSTKGTTPSSTSPEPSATPR